MSFFLAFHISKTQPLVLQLIYKVLSTYTSGKKSYRSHLLCQYSVVALKDANVDPYSNNCVATGQKYSTIWKAAPLVADLAWAQSLFWIYMIYVLRCEKLAQDLCTSGFNVVGFS